MDPARIPHLTRMLVAWSDGHAGALDDLVPHVEAELRRLARSYLRRERIQAALAWPRRLAGRAKRRLLGTQRAATAPRFPSIDAAAAHVGEMASA